MNAPALLNYTAYDHAQDLMGQINDFLKDAPAITSEDIYREGAKLSTLAGKCLADVDAERKRELAPLALETGKINHRYKERTEPFNAILEALTKRLTAFAKAEEDRKAEAAAEARRKADEAVAAANNAMLAAAGAVDDAAAGVVDVDMLAAIQTDKRLHDEAVKALRVAERAERDTVLRVRSPGERAVSMRNRTEYTVTDAVAALTEIGTSPDIDAEIVKRAKAWAKLNGRLPKGVTTTINRSL